MNRNKTYLLLAWTGGPIDLHQMRKENSASLQFFAKAGYNPGTKLRIRIKIYTIYLIFQKIFVNLFWCLQSSSLLALRSRQQSKDYIKLDQVTQLLSAFVLIGIYLYQKQELHKNYKGLCQDLLWQSFNICHQVHTWY